MYAIGVNYKQGHYTKTQMLRGLIPAAGNVMSTSENGELKTFVVVKLGATLWVNGTVLVIDGVSSTVGAAVTASGNPASGVNARVGILCISTATLSSTAAATSFAWCQIYGTCKARISAAVATPGIQLGMGAGAGALITGVVQVSASGQLQGITALATISATGAGANGVNLINVFLQFPRFSGPPDANLA